MPLSVTALLLGMVQGLRRFRLPDKLSSRISLYPALTKKDRERF